MTLPYTLSTETRPALGLITLQSDETIEGDFRRLVPATADFLVSRVPSAPTVTSETLAEMEGHLHTAANLFPRATSFDVVGYGCTSATAEIGAETIANRISGGTQTRHVTDPLSALIAACRHLKVRRLAMLSPYIAPVSEQIRVVLTAQGITTEVFGSFDEPLEEAVSRIDEASLVSAVHTLCEGADFDAVFLSCTNLRTLGIIDALERDLGCPVLSSNQVLAWHMLTLARCRAAEPVGQLLAEMSLAGGSAA